jgi:hypothetical protein
VHRSEHEPQHLALALMVGGTGLGGRAHRWQRAGTIVKGTDDILEVTRKAITLVQAEGYNSDTLAIDAAGAQSLDLLRTPGTEKFYIWGPGQTAGGPFGRASGFGRRR